MGSVAVMNYLDDTLSVFLQTDERYGRFLTCGVASSQGVFVGAWRDWPRYQLKLRSNIAGTAYAYPPDREHGACYRKDGNDFVIDEPEDALTILSIGEYDGIIYAIGIRYKSVALTAIDRLQRVDSYHNSDDTLAYTSESPNSIDICDYDIVLWSRTSDGIWDVIHVFADDTTDSVNHALQLYHDHQQIPISSHNRSRMIAWNGGLIFKIANDSRWYGFNGSHVNFYGEASNVAADGADIYVFQASPTDPKDHPIRQKWNGPITGYFLTTNDNTEGRDHGIAPDLLAPIVWQNELYVIYQESTTSDKWNDPARPYETARIVFGKYTQSGMFIRLWSRLLPENTSLSDYRWTCVANRYAVYMFGSIQGWVDVVNPVEYDSGNDISSEMIITWNGRVVRSRISNQRVYNAFANDDQLWTIGQDLVTRNDDYPQGRLGTSKYRDWIAMKYTGMLGNVLHPIVVNRKTLHSFNLRSSITQLSILNTSIDWSDGSGEDSPEVIFTKTGWRAIPEFDEIPEVHELIVEFGDGNGAISPDVTSARASWNDGSGIESPSMSRIRISWDTPQSWNDRPIVSRATVQFSNGKGRRQPIVFAPGIAWSDGNELVEPLLRRARIGWQSVNMNDPDVQSPFVDRIIVEWSYAIYEIHEGSKVLWITNNDSQRMCRAIQVVSGLGQVVDDQCILLIRTDNETQPIDNWASYETGVLGDVNYLRNTGNFVRVGVVGPSELPDDVDFHFQFIR